MSRVRTKVFLAGACVLFAFAAGTGVIYATSSEDALFDTAEEEQINTDSGSESLSISWKDEVGDISASEAAEERHSSEEIVEDSSTKVRVNPMTGETFTKEEAEAILKSKETVEDSSTKVRIHPMTGKTYTKEEAEAILNN